MNLDDVLHRLIPYRLGAVETLALVLRNDAVWSGPKALEIYIDSKLIVDGTLVSCWSWDDHPELYSGKHHMTGLNIQVACDLAGRLRCISVDLRGHGHSGWSEDYRIAASVADIVASVALTCFAFLGFGVITFIAIHPRRSGTT